jgi:hypothetical protein
VRPVSSGGLRRSSLLDRSTKLGSTIETLPENGIGLQVGAMMNRRLPAKAYAQMVEDSGAGLTHLVYGGLYGLRFKPMNIEEAWNLESPHQWGEAYLSLASDRDLRYAD